MSEDREESRHLMPQTPNAKANFDLVDELLPPDHFDHRLSVDSKLSAQDAYKGHDGLASHDALHRLSIGSFQHGRASPGLPPGPGGTPLHYPDQSSRASRIVTALQKTMDANRGIFLVALSQLFGALMNLAARLLELEGEGMHPFQVLFARQSITMLCASGYMFWKRTPDFPLGNPEVRWLLIARGVSGFFGIYGMWYSMMYLPLAEATVITFLAPSIAGVACYLAFREPFTRVEQFGTLVAFLGVVLIAHPTSLFSSASPDGGDATAAAYAPGPHNSTAPTGGGNPGMDHEATPAERLRAVGVALVGVLGAAGAFTTIRWIGKRTHPLISVNYFATWCTLVSAVVLTAAPALDVGQPALRFALPRGPKQWALLLFLGLMGFIMQFMLTKGMSVDRSNKANAMVFTHMLFAAGFDRWVFGHSMGWMSLAGCGLIIGSALYMVITKESAAPPLPRRERDVEIGGVRDAEGVPMLMEVDDDDDLDALDARRVRLGG
ncbi:hypothetical protein EV126DRAFT_494736 [Verticillium dahliae]|nr:hypothetical protein EV126DRAFT_494736 [Verticillium dahliae]